MEQALRGIVRSRAGDRCEYCLLPAAAVFLPFHVEHIMARQHGGGDDPENLAWACDRCNWLKGPNLSSIDPQTGNITRLFHPRLDEWHKHFALIGAEIIGQTDIGRATVALLQMNVDNRLSLRRHLLDRNGFTLPGG